MTSGALQRNDFKSVTNEWSVTKERLQERYKGITLGTLQRNGALQRNYFRNVTKEWSVTTE